MSIFTPRANYKPFEYPQIYTFTKAINNSFWVHEEVDFTADIQDFNVKVKAHEQEAIKRALLAIAQIEVAVKSFWGDLYKHFPKPEFNGLGATFAECEFRHSEAYSRLLEVLGYNDEFEKLLEIPVFKKKYDMINNVMKDSEKTITDKLLFFTLVIENSSLFSQFAILLSFTRFKGLMKNVSNIIAWTSVDEQIHAQAGVFIINEIKKEQPIFENLDMHKVVDEYVAIEAELIDWVFEEGEFNTFSKKNLLDFIKYRLDMSLSDIGMEKVYNISNDDYKPMAWFEEEVFANSLDDFFAKRPVDYTKNDKSITSNDLF